MPKSVGGKTGRGGRWLAYLRALGPGVVTGASDDDPSGIGTYAQTGALFGYQQLWTALFTLPLMLAVQEMCARIALQTGCGLASLLSRHYPRALLYLCVALLCVANTINIGADLGAMAAAAQLLFGGLFLFWLAGMALVSLLLQIFVPYRRYAVVLRVLALTLLAYVFAGVLVHPPWGTALRHTVVPTLQWHRDYWVNLVAVLGTTISPYLFFWQANQEVEEQGGERTSHLRRRRATRQRVYWMRTDVATGIVFSNVVTWFIIVSTAATLHQQGITTVDSPAAVARILQPLAGPLAAGVFAAGIISTGLLAIPILAGSAAYTVAESFGWREGLSRTFRQAPAFYGIIVLATLLGAGMNLFGVNPIRALYYAAIVNGLIAPPLLALILLIGRNRAIMRTFVNPPLSNLLGWFTVLLMTLAAVGLLWSLRGPH